ncbi:hypothetical protein TCE0_047f17726 [Talaromyces pinophilus]|uniref:Uncharacterized protein n=1 Tax=Talaromyces pinophilus TaxID=128442 RepID=A0A0B8N1W9_TALPI|nr:hypothetical protein TCE0_047f17726 [Talaromyces pinophilus]
MLIQRGYLAPPIELIAILEELFPHSFYVDGKVPISHFPEALVARRTEARSSVDIHGHLNVKGNRLFTYQSTLNSYRHANWDPMRIPDSDVPLTSYLGAIRISQTAQLVDEETGETRFTDTNLVKRVRAQGMDDTTLLSISSKIQRQRQARVRLSEAVQLCLPEIYPTITLAQPTKTTNKCSSTKGEDADLSGGELLKLLRWDVFSDVCGEPPRSGMNYIWIMARRMMVFTQIANDLRREHHPIHVRAYETEEGFQTNKRIGLATLALMEEDEDCLRTMAKAFEDHRFGFKQNTSYWNATEPRSLEVGPDGILFVPRHA